MLMKQNGNKDVGKDSPIVVKTECFTRKPKRHSQQQQQQLFCLHSDIKIERHHIKIGLQINECRPPAMTNKNVTLLQPAIFKFLNKRQQKAKFLIALSVSP